MLAMAATVEGDVIRVKFPYSPEWVNAIKGIEGRWFHPDTKSWTVPKSQYPALVRALPIKIEELEDWTPPEPPAALADLIRSNPAPRKLGGFDLMRHQIIGSDLIRAGNIGLFLATGVGKTPTVLDAVSRMMPLRCLVVCPLALIRGAWEVDVRKFLGDGFPFLDLHGIAKAKRWKALQRHEAGIAAINFESFRVSLDAIGQWRADLLAVDECFAAGTPVDTPAGPRPIETIQPGDEILNCLGAARVAATHERSFRGRVVLITLTDGRTILCSDMHLFLISTPRGDGGWMPAVCLLKEDRLVTQRDALRLVRDAAHPGTGQEPPAREPAQAEQEEVLREVLLGEVEEHPAGHQSEDTGGSLSARGESEVVGHTSKDRASAEDKGREGKPHVGAPAPPPGGAGGPMGPGVHYPNTLPEVDGTSSLLQCGHREPGEEGGDRSGWVQPRRGGAEGAGQEEDGLPGIVGVDRVEILEPSDPRLDAHRAPDGSIRLYDLTVAGHPSFSVRGLLVHNSSKMKDPRSQITKALLKYAEGVGLRVVLLSGTPAPNSKLEYYPQLRILGAKVPRSFYAWRAQVARQCGYMGHEWAVTRDGDRILQEQLASCAWHVSKEDVLDLPERTFIVRPVDLTRAERAAYEEMKEHMVASLLGDDGDTTEVKVNMVLAQLAKLRQMTSGFTYVDGATVTVGRSKLDALLELLEEIGPHPVVLWAHYRAEFAALRKALLQLDGGIVEYHGGVAEEAKHEALEAFRAGRGRYLLASPASIGHGVTLTNASYMVWFSGSYSYEQFHQANDRIYRYGQKNACTYYHLAARDTIDEVLLSVVNDKAAVSQAVLQFLKGDAPCSRTAA